MVQKQFNKKRLLNIPPQSLILGLLLAGVFFGLCCAYPSGGWACGGHAAESARILVVLVLGIGIVLHAAHISRAVDVLTYAGVGLIIIGIYGYAHYCAGYNFPTPWSDEMAFMAQAISFQEDNTLFTPSLNPDRPILWMTPGYMIFTGTLFKMFGFSLEIARSISLVLMVINFALLNLLIHRCGSGMLSLLVSGLFFLNGAFVVTGNVARMDALLLTVVLSGFIFLQRNMDYKGLVVLSLSPLIHPAGACFFLGGLGYFFLSGRFRLQKPTRSDKLCVLISLGIWCGYLFYVLRFWSGFVSDMSYQLNRKLRDEVGANMLQPDSIRNFLLVLSCFAVSAKERTRTCFLLFLAVPAELVYRIGMEMWYDVYHGVFLLFFYLTLMRVGLHVLVNIIGLKSRRIQYAVIGACVAVLILPGLRKFRPSDLLLYPTNLSWCGMQMSGDVSYVTDSDIARVSGFLNSLLPFDRTTYVEFYPRGDSLLFQGVMNENFRFSRPLGCTRIPDVYIVHASQKLPAWFEPIMRPVAQSFGIDLSDKRQIFYQRDGTEKWFYNLGRQNSGYLSQFSIGPKP